MVAAIASADCTKIAGSIFATTTDPVLARRKIRPRSVKVRSAWRTVWRLAANRSHSASSGGSRLPTG